MTDTSRTQQITDYNPMGTDGFEFVKFASAKPRVHHELFPQFGVSHTTPNQKQVRHG